ncbi:MAG: ABC transporter ATP-binding protein [Magnetospirillum sp. WYHS-4]
MTLLEARGLHVYYGESHILHGVDLLIAAGEAVALLGRNGMGKTTTVRALMGLTHPRRGFVRWLGEDITAAPPFRRARSGLGLVPEGRGIFPNLTVDETLAVAARPGGEWTREAVLGLFPRLAERRHHPAGRLSGGEQQMLAIGRALTTHPRLLILDEATEGLAPLVREEIWAVLRRLHAAGLAILVIDKDLETLLGLVDRCAILEKGRIVWDGSTADLAARPDVHLRYLGV